MNKHVGTILLIVLLSPCVFGELSDDINSISLEELWELFLEYPDSDTKAEILIALGMQGRGNPDITEKVNNYLAELNSGFNSGKTINYLMVSASISAVMELNDTSSYPVLFSALYTGYPEVINSETQGALDYIDGNLFTFLSDVIETKPPAEKFMALKSAINSERLNMVERGQLAFHALEQALFSNNDDDADLRAMRYAAVLELTSLRWTNANFLAIRHYYGIREEFIKETIAKNRMVEAIKFLGAVGNSEAALVLGLQLGLINARTEITGSFDAEITLAIVQALGHIGTNTVFDHLLYTSTLSYPDYIKIAAREAADRLRW